MVEISRSKVEHPALATAGGASLHTSVAAIYTKLGDNANSRYLTSDALADSANVDLEHNFNVAFDDLTFLLSERVIATNELLGQLTTGFTITPTAGFEKTKVNVANASGGAKDIALVVVHGGGSGGGGGGGFIWNEPAGSSPTRGDLADERVYDYETVQSQKLVGWVKVPASYVAGKPVKMNIGFVVNSAGTDDVRMESVGTLIKSGDALTSTTNQHTSTNADSTLSGTANALNLVELDISDASGEINSVALAPGDLIKVTLTRPAPSGTEDANDVRFIPSATEVTFS